MEGKPKVLMYSYQPVKSYDKEKEKKDGSGKGKEGEKKNPSVYNFNLLKLERFLIFKYCFSTL